MEDDIKRVLDAINTTNERIEKVLENTDSNNTEIAMLSLKMDITNESVTKTSNILFGDGDSDGLISKIKLLEIRIKDIIEKIEDIKDEHNKTIELEKSKKNKIALTIIGTIGTIITSIIAWFLNKK